MDKNNIQLLLILFVLCVYALLFLLLNGISLDNISSCVSSDGVMFILKIVGLFVAAFAVIFGVDLILSKK